MVVTFDNGTDEGRDVDVWFDQRDISALERNRGRSYSELPQVEATRWAVWHAGRRAMLPDWPDTVEKFENSCMAVNPAEVESVDPTQPAPEGG